MDAHHAAAAMEAPAAEQAVIGAMLLNNGVIAPVAEILGTDPKVFETEPNRKIYAAILALFHRGKPVDSVTLLDELRGSGHLEDAGGPLFIAELTDPGKVPTSANAEYYAGIVREASDRRRLQRIGRDMDRAAKDGSSVAEILERAQTQMSRITVTAGKGGVQTVKLSDVRTEKVSWLWPGRLPRGKLTVLDGDPGQGKSTITLDIAARVSTGSPFPESYERREPEGVVILSAEDGLADTIRPRLEAAGADLGRIEAITGMPDDSDSRPITFPQDTAHVERAIEKMGAGLLIIDPIMAYLGQSTNSHKDQDVRRALHPFSDMADRTGVAVLIVRHLNKAAGGNPLYRGGGSIAIIGAARSALLVGEHPEDDTRRILVVNKSNLGPLPEALVYSLESDPQRDVARIVWHGPTHHGAEDILPSGGGKSDSGELGKAMSFLQRTLADGPMPQKIIMQRATSEGISKRTLKRAKKKLGVNSKKEGVEWIWSPNEECQGVPPSKVWPPWPPSSKAPVLGHIETDPSGRMPTQDIGPLGPFDEETFEI